MADCVHPAMNAVQAACLDTAGQALATNTDVLELLERDHAVLLGGNVGKSRVRAGVGDFLTHVRE
jgi:hypothetical protein